MAKLEANQIPWQKLAEWGIQQRVLEANQEAMQRLIAGRYTPPMNFYRKDDGLSVTEVECLSEDFWRISCVPVL